MKLAGKKDISKSGVSVAMLLPAILIVSVGCAIKEDRLLGTYRASAPCKDITLEIRNDHSFTQTVRTKSGEISATFEGKWSRDGRELIFKPFLDFGYSERGKEDGFDIFSPKRMPRGITLGPVIVKCPDSDHEVDYVK